MPEVPERAVPHDLPDSGLPFEVGLTGAALISERDLARERAPRMRRFQTGFCADAGPCYAGVRTRHRGSVARRA